MTDTPTAVAVVAAAPAPVRTTWKDLVPAIALVITIVTLLVGGGRLIGSIEDHTRRIDGLEQRASRRDEETSDIKARIAGIDAKLDLLIQRTGAERP